jgi:hypothetical protein
MLLLLPGQMDEAWETSKCSALSEDGEHWIENYIYVVSKGLIICPSETKIIIEVAFSLDWEMDNL